MSTPLQPDPTPTSAEHAHENADWWWRDCADRALLWCAQGGFDFTAETLRDLGVPEPDHPNRWGGLFMAAHSRALIEPVGYTQATRPTRAGGVHRIWRGTNTTIAGCAA